MLFDTPFVTVPVNRRGRDFGIGDLHGCWKMLARLMEAVDFNPARDRLFSVGDLVHRGPESVRCLKLAEMDWFYAVMGNHEAMQLGAYLGHLHSSGRFVSSMCEYDGPNDPIIPGNADQAHMVAILERLPLAIEVPLRNGGRVGIVHAGLPPQWTWDDVRALTEKDEFPYERYQAGVQTALLWDREPIIAATAAVFHTDEMSLSALYPPMRRYNYSRACKPVAGLELLISGHTSLTKWPLVVGNRQYIDRGAGKADGILAMVELGTEHYWEVPDPRQNPAMPVTEGNGFQRARHDLPWLTAEELAAMERTGLPPVDPVVQLIKATMFGSDF
jgi:serine/threonine protein phosphatase 1